MAHHPESSNKKKAMGLNQLHNRLLSASHSKPPPSSFLSEMKKPDQQHEYDGPSFNIADFDSPSPTKTLENISDEEKPEVTISTPQLYAMEHEADDDAEYSSTDGGEKDAAEVVNEDEFESVEEGESGASEGERDGSVEDDVDSQDGNGTYGGEDVSFLEDDIDSQHGNGTSGGEDVSFLEDDIDSQNGDVHQKVKIQGRRRLCKVVVKDDEDEDDSFHDVETEFSTAVADFDSPSPAKNTENKLDGGDEIRDILNNLSSKFEFLSIEKGKRPAKQVSSSSVPIVKESFIEPKPEKIVENVDVEKTSLSFASKFSDSSLKAPVIKKEQTKKAASTKSSIRMPENKNDDDSDSDDCVVTSGQKFVQKVKNIPGKSSHVSNDSNAVYTLTDESCNSTSGNERSFSLSNPKFSFSLPGKIANTLYPHQREGLKWLWSLHCKGKGGILGDDMGLGKTMQICGFLAGLFHSNLVKRVLVVAPKTLLPHWMKELGVVNLSRHTKEYFGTCVKARQYELQYVLQDKGILLTTYDIVRNNVKALSGDYDEMEDDELTWDYMILDEGHLIKNPSTQRAKSLLAIPCAHRIIISGTPLQNNLKELWALFNFCCPELLGDKKCFKDKYESAILHGNDKNASDREKRIGSEVAQNLRDCIQPYFLRRLKSEVFRDDDSGTNTAKLSKKNEIIVWLKLSARQRELYTRFLKSEIVLSAFDGSPLAAITILKKICDHPLLITKRAAEEVLEGMESDLNPEDHRVVEKLVAEVADKYGIRENHDVISCKISFITSLLDDLLPKGHNVLIFSQTRKMLNLIQDALNVRNYKFLRIDGTTKATDRLKIVNDFQEGVGAPIFLLTSQVGGLGLTLTKADRVIVVDPAWNPSTDNQSVDRAYRIGQEKDVLVYRLMTCGTVEEKIYRKQIYKGGLFRSATEQKENIRYFSQQDLRELLSLPKYGFDVSKTQEQLHEEHDWEHKMDASLNAHIKFLESLGIAGISHHSLLFSRTAPVPAVTDEELTRIRQTMLVGNSSSRYSDEQHVDAAQLAFNPKDVTGKKHVSSNSGHILTESGIQERINSLSKTFKDKWMILPDKGEKLQKQISVLNSELLKLRLTKAGAVETIDLDEDFNRVMNF